MQDESSQVQIPSYTFWLNLSGKSYLGKETKSWHKIGEEPMSRNDIFTASFIPLFHTGHESPESPRIDFFSYSGGGGGGGIREVSLYFFSPIVMSYESFPIQIRCRYEYSGESAQFGSNGARMHYD